MDRRTFTTAAGLAEGDFTARATPAAVRTRSNPKQARLLVNAVGSYGRLVDSDDACRRIVLGAGARGMLNVRRGTDDRLLHAGGPLSQAVHNVVTLGVRKDNTATWRRVSVGQTARPPR